MHVVLFVLNARQGSGQFLDHVLELRMASFAFIHCSDGSLWRFSNFHGKHHHLKTIKDRLNNILKFKPLETYFWCQCGHFITEAVMIDTGFISGESVLPTRFLFALVDDFLVRADDTDFNVQKTAFDGFEHQSCAKEN